jgi:hypothetical protein
MTTGNNTPELLWYSIGFDSRCSSSSKQQTMTATIFFSVVAGIVFSAYLLSKGLSTPEQIKKW